MSRPHEGDIKAAVMQFFTVLLLSLGLSLTALRALLPQQTLWPSMVLCLLLSLALEGIYLLPLRRKWLLPLALIAALGVWGALGGGPVHTAIQLVRAAFLALRGIPDAAAPYADAARFAVCLIFTLLAAALAWDDTLPLACFAVVTVLALIFVMSNQEGLLLFALPAAAGLVLMMAHGREGRLSPLPVAIVLAVAAFLLVPARLQTVPQLSKLSTDIRQFVEDYLLFNEFRASFTLKSEGFEPLEDRLGGPAEPQTHRVMQVTSKRTLLLKGKSYNEYTGLNWVDTLSSRRYLYASPRFTALREEIFDLNRPLAEDLPEAEAIQVKMLGGSTTTLFAPAFTRSVQTESERMVLYYNQGGELFITRNLQKGDVYTVSCLPLDADTARTARLIRSCEAVADPHYREIEEDYLRLPRHIQQEVRDIAHQAAGSAETPYEKALNIMRYLRSHYRYRLDVKEPPEGVDFVAWFLIGEKEGYCTYFATAMTVLCRLEGIPARYVTGYIASPNKKGVAVVTGQEAHAWTEIYLNGFGWLPLDATPRSEDASPNEDESSSNSAASRSATPKPTSTPKANRKTPTPSPAPASSPRADRTEEPRPAPTPTPQDGAVQAHTPPPEEADAQSEGPDPRLLRWLPLLLLLLLIIIAALRFLFTEPLRRARRKPDRAAEILFAAILTLLRKWGLQRKPAETLHEFAARADAQLSGKGLPALWPLAEQVGSQVYGEHRAPAAPFQSAYTAYRRAAGPWIRIRLAVQRVLGRA